MNEMIITNARYIGEGSQNDCINATIDGVEMAIPLVEGNREYDEIMRQVEAGTITIADADSA